MNIEQYQTVLPLLQDESKDWLDRYIDALSVIEKKSVEYYDTIPLGRLKKKVSGIKLKENTRFPKFFFFQGKLYSVCHRSDMLNGGQFASLTHFTKDPDNIISNMHHILAVVCWPVATKYNAKHHAKRAEKFKRLPIDIAYPIALFFWTSYKLSLEVIPDFLSQQMMTMARQIQQQTGSQNTGGGLQ